VTSIGARVRAIPSWQVTLGACLAALGFLVAAQLQSEPPRVRYTTQERQPLVQTALGLQAQQAQLKGTILTTREQILALEQSSQGSAAQVKQLNDELDAARLSAGLVALHGPGLVIRLEDSEQPVPPGGAASDYLVSARDVRTVVEELWLAGAEAVSVNDERMAVTSAIVDIGGSVLANSAYLAAPFDVTAIGPSDLYDRLSHSQGFVDLVRARAQAFGIRIRFAELADVGVPAYAGVLTLRHGHVVDAGASAPPAPAAAPAASSPGADAPAGATPRPTR
jgi:uncharacterized protein YlxW (UPF0749 family)